MKKMPDYFNELPKSEVIVKSSTYSEQSAAGGYYQSPALDGSRPGVFMQIYMILRQQKVWNASTIIS